MTIEQLQKLAARLDWPNNFLTPGVGQRAMGDWEGYSLTPAGAWDVLTQERMAMYNLVGRKSWWTFNHNNRIRSTDPILAVEMAIVEQLEKETT